jgi:hypothetical protein
MRMVSVGSTRSTGDLLMLEDEREATAIQTRFDGPDFARIENWRRSQARIPALAETVRMLVKRGLDADRRTKERTA